MMQLKIDHKSPVPLHVQAENLLRKLISDPQYQGGKFIPNEVELSKRLAISRTTLRQALNKLVYEGLLNRKKGVGTRGVQNPISSKSNNWLSFSQEMEARGVRVKNYELHLSWVTPDDNIKQFFEIKADHKVLKMERLRGHTDYPFV